MEVSGNYSVQPGFRAHFRTMDIVQNRERWREVGKIFSEKTKDIPKDQFILGRSKEDVKPFFFFTLDKSDNQLDMMRVSDLGNWLLENSNEVIAEKFAKLFRGMKIKQQAMKECIEARRDLVSGKQNNLDLRIAEDNYVEKIVSLCKDDDEMLRIFGYTEEYGNDGILMDFRRDRANRKNCI